MNKTELSAALAEQTGLSKSASANTISALLDIISKELKNGGNVQLIGFGTFDSSQRKARNGRNPQTGKTMKIKAKTVPVFRAGQSLKDAVEKTKKK